MPSKGKQHRPVSTAAISLPQVLHPSSFTSLAHFSPNADLFALLLLAVDKHRLRIFDVHTESVLAEHTVDAARVTTLSWLLLDLSPDGAQKSVSPAKKRKKSAGAVSSDTPPTTVQLVCMGLSNGSIVLFSASHARVLRTVSHPSSLSGIFATSADTQPSQMWSSSADGTIRLWNAARNELLYSWKNEGSIPYSSLALRPGQNPETGVELLVADHSIRLLSLSASTPPISEPDKPAERYTFTGHASVVSHLEWDQSQTSHFISVAQADRVVNVWQLPDPPSKHGNMVANIPLDSFVRHATLSGSASTLLTISVSGRLALFTLPTSPPKSDKVTTLSPRSVVSISSSKKGDENVPIIAATFVPQEHGRLRVARLKGGVKPVFEVVRYLDDADDFIPQVSLSKIVSSALISTKDGGPGIVQTRYVEAPELAVRSGFELGRDSDAEDSLAKGAEGDLDVDLAELSLGQRLTALSGGADLGGDPSSASDTGDPSASNLTNERRSRKGRKGKQGDVDNLPVPAHSLSRTLVQALHSADTRLLETCLIHSDETLVLNTVRRLPPQLAVPLLTACVERLGRGARANTGKGGGGGASAQRGTGLIRWIRAVLVVHTAHLMTIPDVVARLSALHATLTARIALREPLLALNGRLQLVLSQIELRASAGPTPLAPDSKTGDQGRKQRPFKYVEGESESSDDHDADNGDEDEMDVEQEDDAGSIEDVELGADSASDEGEESGSEEEEENSEDGGSDEGPRLNGFIDDDGEEWSEEEEEDLEE